VTTPAGPAWTVGSLLEWTERHFRDSGFESPRLDAQILLAHALGCRRAELYTRFDETPDDERRTRFRELVLSRKAGVPVAYLVGRKEFFLLEFEVGPAALIPRPATEFLVAGALERLKNAASPRILDLGTGTGCIVISLVHRLPRATAVAVDISADAIELARRNATRHAVADRIDFRLGDLFEACPAGESFDCIVSNPPYIPEGEIAGLSPEVRDHEPRLALAGGPDGFRLIDRVVRGGLERLNEGGALLIEVGAGQADRVRGMFVDAGFANVSVNRDLDRIPRVVSGVRPTPSEPAR
jgi:release factor glutamine methyltransferase